MESKMSAKRVLVVEDSKFLRTGFEKILSRSGFEVLVAADGEEGLALACQQVPDVIVLDWIMPRMQGAEVLAKLKQDPKTSSIPVIVISGIQKENGVELSPSTGAAMFLDKNNLNLASLASHVARLCSATDTVQ